MYLNLLLMLQPSWRNLPANKCCEDAKPAQFKGNWKLAWYCTNRQIGKSSSVVNLQPTTNQGKADSFRLERLLTIISKPKESYLCALVYIPTQGVVLELSEPSNIEIRIINVSSFAFPAPTSRKSPPWLLGYCTPLEFTSTILGGSFKPFGDMAVDFDRSLPQRPVICHDRSPG